MRDRACVQRCKQDMRAKLCKQALSGYKLGAQANASVAQLQEEQVDERVDALASEIPCGFGVKEIFFGIIDRIRDVTIQEMDSPAFRFHKYQNAVPEDAAKMAEFEDIIMEKKCEILAKARDILLQFNSLETTWNSNMHSYDACEAVDFFNLKSVVGQEHCLKSYNLYIKCLRHGSCPFTSSMSPELGDCHIVHRASLITS
ncbi:hypothetical protein HPP92_028629 [Vanilla planifolia]|uniref:Uncharacterized protein n=1 Tax=Vanilla planifolia TaxID=51239 RepID=A0A835P784_VANPL|nr:hypothetical protein HPP92_028629 [Vanilla planifolia]